MTRIELKAVSVSSVQSVARTNGEYQMRSPLRKILETRSLLIILSIVGLGMLLGVGGLYYYLWDFHRQVSAFAEKFERLERDTKRQDVWEILGPPDSDVVITEKNEFWGDVRLTPGQMRPVDLTYCYFFDGPLWILKWFELQFDVDDLLIGKHRYD